MTIRTTTLVVSGVLAIASGCLALEACSSSSTSTPDDTADAGQKTGSTTDGSVGTGNGVDGSTNNGGTDGSTGNQDAGGPACASPPKLFPPKPDGGLYCPFSASADGGSLYCGSGDMCCLSPSSDAGSSDCEKQAAACTNAAFKPWECASPQDCAGNANGPTCCLVAGPLEADPNCSGYQKTKGFDTTKCTQAASCTGTVVVGSFTDDQTIVCEAQADCPNGKTCTAVKTTGTPIGLCL